MGTGDLGTVSASGGAGRRQLTSPVNVAAQAAGLERTIAGWVPHFSAMAPVLAGSDLLSTLADDQR